MEKGLEFSRKRAITLRIYNYVYCTNFPLCFPQRPREEEGPRDDVSPATVTSSFPAPTTDSDVIGFSFDGRASELIALPVIALPWCGERAQSDNIAGGRRLSAAEN